MTTALDEAAALARGAGELLTARFGRLAAGDIGAKSDRRDLVTAADLESERFLLDGLRRAFPEDAILAEESGAHPGDGDARWYVDPLDGPTPARGACRLTKSAMGQQPGCG